MSWEQLIDIRAQNLDEWNAEQSTPPTACPNDGTPLTEGPDGQLRCRFDGWMWNGLSY